MASRHTRSPREGGLNLLPFMNLVTLLIPLLLIASQFVELAVIDSTLPGIIAKDELPVPSGDVPLQLRLEVTTAAVTVRGAEAVLGSEPVVACTAGCRGLDAPDLQKLRRVLEDIKRARPETVALWVQPENAVPFDVLVALMDVSRESAEGPLFPDVRFAG